MDAGALIKEARERAGITQAELARRAGTSQPTIAAYESGAKSPSTRTLDRLVRSAGFTLEVSLLPSSPAVGEELTRVGSVREQVLDVARRHRIRNVRVFGSVARGEESPSSDIDLLVDMDVERRGVVPLIAFAKDVEALLHVSVDATTEHLLSDAVRRSALAEAVPL